MNRSHRNRSALRCLLVMLAAILISQAIGVAQSPTNHPKKAATAPSISIDVIPPASLGGPGRTYPISGRIHGVAPAGHKVVVYAFAGGTWWVQPTVAQPLTDINGNGGWATDTYGGATYAALLVRATYKPSATAVALPGVEGDVLASTREAGK